MCLTIDSDTGSAADFISIIIVTLLYVPSLYLCSIKHVADFVAKIVQWEPVACVSFTYTVGVVSYGRVQFFAPPTLRIREFCLIIYANMLLISISRHIERSLMVGIIWNTCTVFNHGEVDSKSCQSKRRLVIQEAINKLNKLAFSFSVSLASSGQLQSGSVNLNAHQ